MKKVFLPTIQHTGTWFMLETLKKAGYEFVERHNINSVFDLRQLSAHVVLHTHYPLGEGVLFQENFKFSTFAQVEETYENLNYDNQCLMIIPIRDVLGALVTRHGRHPGESNKYLVKGFVSIAKQFEKFNPIYFTVDLLSTCSLSARMKALNYLEKLLEGRIEYKHTIASEWQLANSQGSYNLKEAYHQGNYGFIKQTIPEDCEYLEKNRNILQPFFERLGYKKLLWFEEE